MKNGALFLTDGLRCGSRLSAVYSTICTIACRAPRLRTPDIRQPLSPFQPPSAHRTRPPGSDRFCCGYLSTAPDFSAARGVRHCAALHKGLSRSMPDRRGLASRLLPRPASHRFPQRPPGELRPRPTPRDPGAVMLRLVPSCTGDVVCAAENVQCPVACHSGSCSPRSSWPSPALRVRLSTSRRGSTRGGYEPAGTFVPFGAGLWYCDKSYQRAISTGTFLPLLPAGPQKKMWSVMDQSERKPRVGHCVMVASPLMRGRLGRKVAVKIGLIRAMRGTTPKRDGSRGETMNRLRVRLLIGLVVAVALAWGATLDLTAAKAAAKATATAVATATAATKAPAKAAAPAKTTTPAKTTVKAADPTVGEPLPSRPIGEAAQGQAGQGQGHPRPGVRREVQEDRAVRAEEGGKAGRPARSEAWDRRPGQPSALRQSRHPIQGECRTTSGPTATGRSARCRRVPSATVTVVDGGTGYTNPLVTIDDAYLPAASHHRC